MPRIPALLLVLIPAGSLVALAQPGDLPVFSRNNMPDVEQQAFEFEADEAYQARDAEAEANFDAIMIPQNAPATPMPAPASPSRMMIQRRSQGAVGGLVSGEQQPAEAESSVEVPLKQFGDLRERIKEIAKKNERLQGPVVVLGSSEFSGRAIQGALSLQLKLQVTLGRPDRWKTVPLVGDDVVLVGATVGGRPIPVSRRSGFHVWVTRQSGEAAVTVDLLVPARGPRGSIEYDFRVSRTPVTQFTCHFPVAGLEPRMDKAVQSEARPDAGGTLLVATLRPTTRIHLVGFRDLGEAEGQRAKVYAETLNLLSVDEGTLDLFTVIRYTILYSGTKEFLIQVPKGLTVESADGQGAFRFVPEKNEQGTLIKGETAFPIRNHYEISLRLRRESPKKGEVFDVPLPRCLGVEREHGWLGVEVPGKLMLEEGKEIRQVLRVDVRQLPEEMIRSAVSPILRAYRYHSHEAQIRLVTTRLPEKEPESGSIDRIRAHTTVTQEGNVMTDMRITLRNRLRHSLTLTVPPGTRVLSTHLDGQKVKPSESEQGKILLPLKRSTGTDRLQAFTLSVVMERQIGSLGWLGAPDLRLPGVDLPVSSLAWSVYLPARNRYRDLEGDIEPQVYAGQGSWHRPSYGFQPDQWAGQDQPAPVAGVAVGAVDSAHTGAMPVRIKLPQHGVRLDYSRFWIDKNHPVEVSFFYYRSWLRYPAWLLLAAVFALGMLLISMRFGAPFRRVRPWVGGALVVAVIWPMHRLGGDLGVFLAILLGLAAIVLQRGWHRTAPGAIATWWRSLPQRFRDREKAKEPTALATTGKVLIGVGLCVFGLLLLDAAVRFLALLMYPL